MKRSLLILVSALILVLLLAGGAFVGGRLLGGGSQSGNDGLKVHLGTGNGRVVDAELVPAAEYPDSEPAVAGAFVRRQDNSLFINETEGGFVIGKNEEGDFSVTNSTGQIDEVVVTGETAVYVNVTFDNIDQALADSKLYQKLDPGSVDEIGDLSFVQAWGEMRDDRLIASVLIYTRPPVISR
jgi:hypothetical protein